MVEISNKLRFLRKPGASRDILMGLLTAGAVMIALSGGSRRLTPGMLFRELGWSDASKIKRSRISFYHLRSAGLISVDHRKGMVHVSLTKEGARRAEALAAMEEIRGLGKGKRKSWDGRWRIVMFDVPSERRLARDAFRKLLVRAGFVQLQKSVWVSPHDVSKDVAFLKDFFKLSDDECRLITSSDIGDDRALRTRFKV